MRRSRRRAGAPPTGPPGARRDLHRPGSRPGARGRRRRIGSGTAAAAPAGRRRDRLPAARDPGDPPPGLELVAGRAVHRGNGAHGVGPVPRLRRPGRRRLRGAHGPAPAGGDAGAARPGARRTGDAAAAVAATGAGPGAGAGPALPALCTCSRTRSPRCCSAQAAWSRSTSPRCTPRRPPATPSTPWSTCTWPRRGTCSPGSSRDPTRHRDARRSGPACSSSARRSPCTPPWRSCCSPACSSRCTSPWRRCRPPATSCTSAGTSPSCSWRWRCC